MWPIIQINSYVQIGFFVHFWAQFKGFLGLTIFLLWYDFEAPTGSVSDGTSTIFINFYVLQGVPGNTYGPGGRLKIVP